MKKVLKWLIFFLVLAFIAAAGVIYWQRENLKAVKDALSYTTEEIEQQISENQQQVQNVVDRIPEVVVRDLNEEEKEALKDGSVTVEDLVDKLIERPIPESSPVLPQAPEQQPTTPPAPPVSEEQLAYEHDLSALVARVYVLRQEFSTKLDTMQNEAKEAYRNMSESERTKTKLMKWASGYISKAGRLESDCDAQMDAILSEMDRLVKEHGGDSDLVDEVAYSYAKEKSLKKSWYMTELKKRGLV